MSKYSKAIVAAIGLLVIIGKDFFGITVPQSTVDQVSNGILSLLTIVAIVKTPNTPS